MYLCNGDSVANDYRFAVRMRDEQSFLKLFIDISILIPFFYPDFFNVLSVFYSLPDNTLHINIREVWLVNDESAGLF